MRKYLKRRNLITCINTQYYTRSNTTIEPQNRQSEETLFNKNLNPIQYVSQTSSNVILATKSPKALNFWLNIPQDKLDAIEDLFLKSLNGILLLDDVQDNTQYRRYYPASHRIYGIPLTINSAILSLGEGCMTTFTFGHPMAPQIYCKNMQEFWNGQGLEIYWRDNYICPTENEYTKMAEKKTGICFLLLWELMQLFSENKTNYRDFLLTLAIYFQIRDEYCNLATVEGLEEKSRVEYFKNLKDLVFCEDISEGKFTWPIIHALKTQEAATIRSILFQRTRDVNIKQHCLALMDKVGSLDFTRKTLTDLHTKLREQVDSIYIQVKHFGGNPDMVNFLDELYTWNSK